MIRCELAPHKDNVQDACDSVCQYALWEEFPGTSSLSVVEVRTFRVPLRRFGLLYSGHPDEFILETDFDYYQARNILRNSFPSVPLRSVRGTIETKYLIVNPDSKNPNSKAMAGWFTGEGSGSLISLVNFGYRSREDLIQIGRRLSPKVSRGTEVFYSMDISITVTEISCRNRKNKALTCTRWTDICWILIFFRDWTV